MELSTQHFLDDQGLFWAVGNDREMQWNSLGKVKGEIVVSAVKLSCS
jgi:hypothetical protein